MFTTRKGFLSASVVKFPMEMKKIINKSYQNFPKYWEFYTYNSFKRTWPRNFQKMKVHIALPRPPFFLHGSEIWTIRKKKGKKRLASVEIKFLGNTAGYTIFDQTKGMKKFLKS